MPHRHVTPVHLAGDDPRFAMPYTPAIKVHAGALVFCSGVTAAPVYHSHPHVAAEFDGIPADPGEQAALTVANLREVLRAAGGELDDIVELTRYMVDQHRTQDAINRVMAEALGGHRPATTSVEVVRLATDPRLVLELTAVAVVAA